MFIGVPKESKDQEYRVGLTPDAVRSLTLRGHRVCVERNAGTRIGLTDAAFLQAGASIAATTEEVYQADFIVKVKELQAAEWNYLRAGQMIFAYLHIAPNPQLATAMLGKKVIGIAYETVRNASGNLPLLKPMSMIAGRLAIQVGAWGLQINNGGNGTLLCGGPNITPGHVLVLGAGNAGSQAVAVAVRLGTRVTVLSNPTPRLDALVQINGDKIRIDAASETTIAKAVVDADLIVGAILKPGNLAPKLLTRAMLRRMRPGSVLVDICIDQGGLSETSRPTSHSQPFYIDEGIVHYCVGNMPSAVALSATQALVAATLPYVQAIADHGLARACDFDSGIGDGVQLHRGQVTHPGIARDLNLPYMPLASAVTAGSF